MADPNCPPPCGPNDPVGLPVNPPPVPCCDVDPATPVTGIDCDGNPVVSAGVQTVPHPTAVQLVRLCDVSGEVDTLILCDPVTGDRVIVVVSYTPAGLPITDAYNLDGTPYLGVISDLIACAGPALDSEALPWCFNGANVTQWVVTEDGEPTGAVFWTDAAGAVIPAPAPGPTLVRGVCQVAAFINQEILCDVLPDEPVILGLMHAGGNIYDEPPNKNLLFPVFPIAALTGGLVANTAKRTTDFATGEIVFADPTHVARTTYDGAGSGVLVTNQPLSNIPVLGAGPASLQAIAYNPADGQIYALYRELGAVGGAQAALVQVNTATGVLGAPLLLQKPEPLIPALQFSIFGQPDWGLAFTTSGRMFIRPRIQGAASPAGRTTNAFMGEWNLATGNYVVEVDAFGNAGLSTTLYALGTGLSETIYLSDGFSVGTNRITQIDVLGNSIAQTVIGPESTADSIALLTEAQGSGGGTTSFIRRYSTDSNGVTTFADLELDGVTPYTPVGEVGICCCEPPEPPPTPTNQYRSSGVLPALTVFDLAAASGGVEVVSFTVSFLEGFGTIDGLVTPPGTWSWSAEDGQEITNLPTNITAPGQIFVHWVERT